MNEEIFDVILLSTGNFRADLQTFQENRPPEEDFYLNEDMWVGRLPKGVSSKLVFDSCDAPGWQFHPARQYGMRYAFCRKVEPPHAAYYQWDHDQTIGYTILLSRFIRPTTIGTSLSARLYFVGDELKTIVPGPTQSNCSNAWIVAEGNWRDWLSVPELEQLRDLLPTYNRNAPEKVRLARKHIDNAFYAFFLDERFASLVTAYESLLKTSRNDLTEQFKVRASRLAEILGLELSREDLQNTYSHRSDFVHGSRPNFEGLNLAGETQTAEPSEIHPELIGRYNRCESVLRLALLRASTEPQFAELFSSVDAIERAFGTPIRLTPEQKRLALLRSVSDEELQAEFTRRYGHHPFAGKPGVGL
jgi:hypothetical protein